MRSKLVLISLLFLSFVVNPYFPKKWEIPQSSTLIAVDSLGKLYQVNEKSVIKYSSEGKEITRYSLYNTGSISSIDTRNALQTLLFFKDQQEIVLLDNMLGESRKIQLTDYFDWIDLACFSNRDNAFWFYSISAQSLIKTNKELEVLKKLDNISQLLNTDLNPTQLFEREEKVYLLDPKHGVFVFDIFGNYTKKIVLESPIKMEVQEDILYYLSNNSIKGYHLLTFDKTNFLTQDTIVDFCTFANNIYVQNESKLVRVEAIKE